MTDLEMAELDLKHARELVAEKILKTSQHLRDYAERVARYASRITDPDPGTGIPVRESEVASWATNEIENCVRNLNLSQIVSAAARLAGAEERTRILKAG